jgi:predicted glycosyltransferase
MAAKNVLFISGSLGLGHIGRDLEIARALRNECSNIMISWIADDPATQVLLDAGEILLPEAVKMNHGNQTLDDAATDYSVNLTQWVMKMRSAWSQNTDFYAQLFEQHRFDLVIGDETYDLQIGLAETPQLKQFPFVIIYDFLGLDTVTSNPIDHLATYMTNRLWVKSLTQHPPFGDLFLFLGEKDDVPDRSFGFLLPNRRAIAKKYLDFVGYILPFNPQEYLDPLQVRASLGYSAKPLIICSIGGTAGGKPLLELCADAYPLIQNAFPDLHMVLVCGPRLSPDSIKAPSGVEVRGYVPELYKHLAASDLSIVTGGGTITLELTALQRPFIYFPFENHFEQEIDVAHRCQRHHAGVRMKYSTTTPQQLADAVIANLDTPVAYTPIATDGAQKAAKLISNLL